MAIDMSKFKEQYYGLVDSVCKDMGLSAFETDKVYDKIVDRVCSGRLVHDPTRGKFSTLLHRVARNLACDCLRIKKCIRYESADSKTLEAYGDLTVSTKELCHGLTYEEVHGLTAEALKRLFAEKRNVEHLKIFAERFLLGKDRDEVAVKYGCKSDYVSLVVKTRLFPCFQKHFRRALAELMNGELELSDDGETPLDPSVRFLEPLLPW